ncbi:MAG TPA: hypothetical protein VI461_13030, partial [Chitinophagaceae bacterium]|nr:hypothetical protein [Chitinophagaceae bacterium]
KLPQTRLTKPAKKNRDQISNLGSGENFVPSVLQLSTSLRPINAPAVGNQTFITRHLPDSCYCLNFKLLILNHEQAEVKGIIGKSA